MVEHVRRAGLINLETWHRKFHRNISSDLGRPLVSFTRVQYFNNEYNPLAITTLRSQLSIEFVNCLILTMV